MRHLDLLSGSLSRKVPRSCQRGSSSEVRLTVPTPLADTGTPSAERREDRAQVK
jgi:hypothetical protein